MPLLKKLSLIDLVEYGMLCFKVSNNSVVSKLPDKAKIDILFCLGLGMLYDTLCANELLNGDITSYKDIPYPVIYTDIHSRLEISESYTAHPVLSKLYDSNLVIVLCSHDVHTYLSTFIEQSAFVYCIGCKQRHLRTSMWFDKDVVNTTIDVATCKEHLVKRIALPLYTTHH